MLFWSASLIAHADSDVFKVDTSPCIEGDCQSNKILFEFSPENSIQVGAGFNIVHWGGDRGTKFYPLFQVYNHTDKPVDVTLGLQLLDAKKSVLKEIDGTKSFNPTTISKPSYETSASISAKSVTRGILQNTRYMKVVFRRNKKSFGSRTAGVGP